MSILKNAEEHYKGKIAGSKKVEVKVPEWGSKKSPAVLYMRHYSCCSVRTASKIAGFLENPTLESMVDIIMLLATDSAEFSGDRYVFDGKTDRLRLMTKVDPAVITRIFNEWADAEKAESDLAEGSDLKK